MEPLPDDAALAEALRAAKARLDELEASTSERRDAFMHAQRTLDSLRRHRLKGRVPMWEGASRAALRSGVLAVGCVALIAGAATLDPTFGGVAIVASFGVLLAEGVK